MKIRNFKLFVVAMACCAVQATGQNTSWVSIATSDVQLDTALAQRIYVSDINNDGYPDFVTIKGAASVDVADNLKVYINVESPIVTPKPKRMFVDVTTASGINQTSSTNPNSIGTTVAALADVNNDGNVDVVRGNYYGTSLSTFVDNGDRCEVLLGDGQGHFTIVPNNGLRALGLINPTGFSFLDYNKDGNIDLFIAVWFSDYTQDVWHSGYLMKGNGDGTFTNVSASSKVGTKTEPMFGSCAVDWNNDGWPDIATAPYCRTGGQLWKNNGDGTFTDMAASANYNAKYMQGDNGQNLCMWGSMPEDYDNDGDMDFFFALTHGGNDANEGHSTIVLNGGSANSYHLDWALNKITWNSPKSSHHGDYDASWFDMENDGLEDVVMMQAHYMPPTDRLYVFHQQPDHSLMDVTQALGLLTTDMQDSHQVEALDFDLDGDDDILFCNNVSHQVRLIKNEKGQDNHWTAIRLRAPAGVNKNAIGARIKVWAGGVERMREVYAGRGNAAGQQPLAMIFGLGSATTIDSIKIFWPDVTGTVTKLMNIPIDRYLIATTGGLGVSEATAQDELIYLKTYPNPAKDFLLVQLSNNAIINNIALYNMTGQQMSDAIQYNRQSGGTTYCSIKDLPPAQYIIKVTAQNGAVYSHPIIKMN